MRYAKTLILLTLMLATPSLAQEAPAYDLTALLCSRFDAKGTPVGKVTDFFTDQNILCYRVESSAPVPAGTKLVPGLAKSTGEALGRAAPLAVDGKASAWNAGIPLAGAPWALSGGDFIWQLFRNEEPEPVVSIPFSIKSGKRWALLVGIKDYPPAGPENDLAGCDLDLQKMKILLTEYFFIPAEQVVVLADLQATRARIEEELIAMADRAGESDAVVFYYSGHGAQVPDLDGDEDDGWDEAICPAEVKPKLITSEDQLKLYLTDDRIAELLDRFKTKNVTVIFDCCHSGTGLRAGDDEPTLPEDLIQHRFETGHSFSRGLQERAAEARAAGKPKGAGHSLDRHEDWVFISGCQSWETSAGNPVQGGYLTLQLVNALATSGGESWAEIMTRVRQGANRMNPGQTPGVEGATRRHPFSLAEAEDDTPYVRPTLTVIGAVTKGTARSAAPQAIRKTSGQAGTDEALVAGLNSLYGEQVGERFDVYPPLGPGGKPKGRLELTGQVSTSFIPDGEGRPVGQAQHALATILSGTVDKGDRLLPLDVRMPSEKPRVGLHFDKAQRPNAVALFNAYNAEPALTAVDGWKTPATLDYIVSPTLIEGQLVARIFNRGGTLMTSFKGTLAELVKETRDFMVKRHNELSRVMRLTNPSPPFRLKVTVDGGEGGRPSGPIKVRGVCDIPAYIFAYLAWGDGNAQWHAGSKEMIAAGKPFEFSVKVQDAFKGRLQMKVFASTKILGFEEMRKAKDVSTVLYRYMRAQFPSVGRIDFLSTEGWASESVWIDCR